MNLEELKNKMSEEGLELCPICGLPFKRYHLRQKTCGDPACKKKYHAQYIREYHRKQREDNPQTVKEYRRNAKRKYRRRQQELKQRAKQLEQLGDHWNKKEDFSKQMDEYDGRYGDLQQQKILASVPKIDVSMGGEDDTVHIKDDTTGS